MFVYRSVRGCGAIPLQSPPCWVTNQPFGRYNLPRCMLDLSFSKGYSFLILIRHIHRDPCDLHFSCKETLKYFECVDIDLYDIQSHTYIYTPLGCLRIKLNWCTSTSIQVLNRHQYVGVPFVKNNLPSPVSPWTFCWENHTSHGSNNWFNRKEIM